LEIASSKVYKHYIQVNMIEKSFLERGDPIQLTETAKRVYEEIFRVLKNGSDWKRETTRVVVRSLTEAHLIAEALTFHLGGSEIEVSPVGGYKVGSKGYYHYIKN
jgi:hypothetical protein